MGKHKPIYDPSTDCGDYVVCTGLSQLHTTGKKMQKKKYYSHTTRPGSLKEITMERMMEKWGGGEILRRAVRGMLPKNRLRDDRMARLKCEYILVSLRFAGFRWENCKADDFHDRLRGPRTSLQAKHPPPGRREEQHTRPPRGEGDDGEDRSCARSTRIIIEEEDEHVLNSKNLAL